MKMMAVVKNASISAGKVAIKAGMKLRKASPEIMTDCGSGCGCDGMHRNQEGRTGGQRNTRQIRPN